MSNYPVHHGIKLAQNSTIENLKVEVLQADPAQTGPGRIWYNEVDKVLKSSSLDSQGNTVIKELEPRTLEGKTRYIWANGILVYVDYGSGKYKSLVWRDGVLASLDYSDGTSTYRKIFYRIEGLLVGSEQTKL